MSRNTRKCFLKDVPGLCEELGTVLWKHTARSNCFSRDVDPHLGNRISVFLVWGYVKEK